jgi:3-isopropylmalate dehydrogenase
MFKILVIPGDGVGTEVISTCLPILDKISQKFNHKFSFEDALMGHCAILKNQTPLPKETLEKAYNSDAILFGAIGHPIYDKNPKLTVRPEQGLLELRQKLNLFANLRPIKIFPELIDSSPLKKDIIKDVDILFVRELTGGIYFGKPSERRQEGQVAVDTCIYSKQEITRVTKIAFDLAKKRNKKVTSVDKANVLETSKLWRETVTEIAKDYPEVVLEHQFVDSMAMKLISHPKNYDVILTENLFGDILTDQASQITGSLGLLPSASLNNVSNSQNQTTFGLYEPIHGSAPDISGKNIANPLAAILSCSMLLEISFNLKKEARILEKAVSLTLKQGFRTLDLMPNSNSNKGIFKLLGTKEMGQKVLENLDLIE